MRKRLVALSLVLSAAVLAVSPVLGPAFAQVPTTPKNNPHNTYGSPLDTIRSAHLWTHVAPVKDFVRESRPDPTTLKYQPLTGKDPERPKLRDPANLEALQAELEHDSAVNNGKLPAASRKTPATHVRHAKADDER